MPSREPARRNALLLVALLFAQLLLMSASLRGAEGAALLEMGALRGSIPVVATARRVGVGFGRVLASFRNRDAVERETGLLRGEVGRLRIELDRHREAALENLRLRRLLGMRQSLAPRSQGASVVAASLSGQVRMVVLDRGTEDGIRPDQPVVGWGGAVGRVILAGRRLSKVRLLSDSNSGVAGVVQRSRVEGMVLGQGDGPLLMVYAPRFSDVVLGDRVVTSGADGIFPRGFGIGRVISVVEDSPVSKRIHLEPEIDDATLEEVLVLLEPVGGEALAPPEVEGPR